VNRVSCGEPGAAPRTGTDIRLILKNNCGDFAVPNSNALSQRGAHTGVPTHFHAHCREVTRGGDRSYYSPGYALARAVGADQPYGIDMDEWVEEIGALQELLAEGDTEGTWRWFVRHYPKMMALIPPRRREKFICGVRAAYDDGCVELGETFYCRLCGSRTFSEHRS